MASSGEEEVGVRASMLDQGAKLLQSLTPVRQIQQHVCTWAMYAHDMNRKIETHHFATRLNEDFVQCAVFDSDQNDARLIGVEYIISDRLFGALPAEEQKLWHSHVFEIKQQGLWVNPGIADQAVQQVELKKMARTYGKFWCTWQVDRGDNIPKGAPVLMMSPQELPPGQVADEDALVGRRDAADDLSSAQRALSRAEIEGPEVMHPLADYWKKTGKGSVVEMQEVSM